jgi:hypothetical protein
MLHGADPEQRLVMAETLGRILVHMGRLPDTRWMATKARREQALRRISRCEAELTRSLGVHLRIRIDSVRAALLRQPVDADHGDPVEGFRETEELMPMFGCPLRVEIPRAEKLRTHAEIPVRAHGVMNLAQVSDSLFRLRNLDRSPKGGVSSRHRRYIDRRRQRPLHRRLIPSRLSRRH